MKTQYGAGVSPAYAFLEKFASLPKRDYKEAEDTLARLFLVRLFRMNFQKLSTSQKITLFHLYTQPQSLQKISKHLHDLSLDETTISEAAKSVVHDLSP